MTQPPPGTGYGPEPGYGQPYYGAPQQTYQPQAGYYPPAPNPEMYTPWADRVLAFLIDQLPVALIFGVGYAAMLGSSLVVLAFPEQNCVGDVCRDEPSMFGVVLMIAVMVVVAALPLAYMIWNYGYRQGRTGQSIGKQVMKFKVVSEKSGQPIGFGMSLVRQLAHGIDSLICYIGYLFPLWDPKRQTIADKMVSTVCVRVPPQYPQFPPYPPASGMR